MESDFGMMPFSRHGVVSLYAAGSTEALASSRILKTCRHPRQQKKYALPEKVAEILSNRSGRPHRSQDSAEVLICLINVYSSIFVVFLAW
jgi:hypothetical protein